MSKGTSSYLIGLREAFLTTWPLFTAGAVTAAFSWWVYGLATEQLQTDSGQMVTRWHQFISGEPNTMGDTLAGFIGSLTLIWVVASVIQQSMELRAQRAEFTHMVNAQQAQVEALNAQAEIFRQEYRYREQDRYEQLLDQQIERLRSDLVNYIPKHLEWSYKSIEATEFDEPWIRLRLLYQNDLHELKMMTDSEFFRSAGLRLNSKFLEIASKQEAIVSKPKASTLTRVIKLLDAIIQQSDNVSDAQKQRIENHRFVPLRNFFVTIKTGPLFEQDKEPDAT